MNIWGDVMQIHMRHVAWNLMVISLLLAFSLVNGLNLHESRLETRSLSKSQPTEFPDLDTVQNHIPIGNEPVTFDNVSSSSNISGFRSDSFAWGDYNNDGYLDFITRGNTSLGTRLFRNNGPPGWNFTDVTEAINLCGNVSNPNRGYPIWGDYDNDGYLDIFMAGDNDMLWHNNGPPAWNFTDVTILAGNLNDTRPSEAAAWGDYDRDGYIDLYVNSWYRGTTYYRDVLWHNNGDGTFTDVSSSSGINTITTPAYKSPPFAGMTVSWGDYNNDGWLDIYVGKYHVTPNSLFRNNHDGTFTDVALVQGVAGNAQYYGGFGPGYGHSAGTGWGDFNNDGDLDLWVSNLAHKDDQRSGMGRGYYCDDSMLYLNNGGPFFEFEDIRNRTGIPIIPVGTLVGNEWKDEDFFGVTWGDYDNDCDLDVWVPQVKTYHSWANSYLWQNNNNETFTDQSDAAGIKVWSNTGGAWGDYNNDGFIDLITEGTYPYQGKRETRLFKSNGNSNNWLQLRLNGTLSNSAAIGARVTLSLGELRQTREIGGDAGGHGFQNSFIVEFGLGQNTKADEVMIVWPSGVVQVLKNVAANQILNVTEDTTGPKITGITVDDYEVNEDDTLIFTATTTGSPLIFEWDFDNDGVIDYYNSNGGAPNYYHSYNRSGNFTAKLWVWKTLKSLGWVETSDIILINNVAPTAVAGVDITPWEDQVIEFDASASLDTPSDKDTLEYNWSFDDSDETYSGWIASPIAKHAYPDNGVYYVELQVRDDDNFVSTDIKIVTVQNWIPTLEIVCNSTADEDETVIFSIICNDTPSDRESLEYSWDFDDGESTNWLTGTSVSHTFTKNGLYFPTCWARDDDQTNSTESFIFVKNIAPECWVNDDVFCNEDEEVYFTAYATDTPSDRGSLTYKWDFGDGSGTNWLESGWQNISYTYTNQGFYQANLMVIDDDSDTAEKTVNVTVLNIAPNCEAFAVDNPEELYVNEDDIVFLTGSGEDTESDLETLEYRWSFSDPNMNSTEWNKTSEYDLTFTNEGQYNVTLTVRDDNGESNTALITIYVLNVKPEAKISMSGSSIQEDDTIEFDAKGSLDTPSDLAILNFTWDFGEDTPFMYNKSLQYKFTKSGDHRIRLIVTDDNGAEDIELSGKISVTNKKPAAEFDFYPIRPEKDSVITFSAVNSTDTPTDRLSLNFTWDFGDKTPMAYGEVVKHVYSKSGRHKVTLTVRDDDDSIDITDDVITISGPDAEPGDDEPTSAMNTGTIIAGIVSVIIVVILILFLLSLKWPEKVPVLGNIVKSRVGSKGVESESKSSDQDTPAGPVQSQPHPYPQSPSTKLPWQGPGPRQYPYPQTTGGAPIPTPIFTHKPMPMQQPMHMDMHMNMPPKPISMQMQRPMPYLPPPRVSTPTDLPKRPGTIQMNVEPKNEPKNN